MRDAGNGGHKESPGARKGRNHLRQSRTNNARTGCKSRKGRQTPPSPSVYEVIERLPAM
jgi:hypothetical protein